MESGKWKMESGKWKVESGKWKVESGKWKGKAAIGFKSLATYQNRLSKRRAVSIFFCHPEQAERSEGSILVKDPY
jgi:hypothetical protein